MHSGNLISILSQINYTHFVSIIIGFSMCFLVLKNPDTHKSERIFESQSKIYSIHKMELRDDVTGEELEAFFNERFFPNWDIPGWNSFLVKGDRGERKGRYALIHEIESVEMRDRYFPEPDQATDLWERYTEGLEEISAELDELVSVYLGEVYTDYYVVGN